MVAIECGGQRQNANIDRRNEPLRLSIIALLLIATSHGASAQIVGDLYDEIDSGNIRLMSANGNGSLSGAAVEGSLSNRTESPLRVNVYLARPIFLANDGEGQNMVASEVYLGDGDYMSDGRRPFIELAPGEETSVRFIAYCVDFARENPSSEESFSIGTLPASLESVMSGINAFAFANPSMDIAATAQMAIWLAQGESAEDIKSRIEVSEAEEGLARYFSQ